MKDVFKDKKLQEDFWKEGFVKIKMFNDEEIQQLRGLHESLHPNERFNTQEINVKYHFSFLDTNKDYKVEVFEKLSAFFAPKLDKFLLDYEPLVINFVQKEPGFGEVPIHQNWNFVDETKYVSVSIWCPLVDVEEINGTLEVIPKTHVLFREVLRSPSIPWFFKEYNKQLINEYCIPISVKAGECLIFDDSIIHYSKQNNGTYDRLVIQVIAKPREAQAKHYYMKKSIFKTEVQEMHVDKDFFLNFNYHITDKPTGEISSKIINYKHPKINKKKFDTILSLAK